MYFHLCDALLCADIDVKDAINKERKLIPLKNETSNPD
jgi:hypothetical protein